MHLIVKTVKVRKGYHYGSRKSELLQKKYGREKRKKKKRGEFKIVRMDVESYSNF